MKSDRSQKMTVIVPSNGTFRWNFREICESADMLMVMTFRDVKVRYKQTALGGLWAIIQPIVTMVIFSVIFGRWAKFPSEGVPYPVFVYAGLLPWLFFSNALATASNSVMNAGAVINKVYFPRIIIPISSVLVSMIDFIISMGVMMGLLLYFHVPIGLKIVLVIPFALTVVATAAGFGAFFSAMIVKYRDLRFVVPFLLQIWMYVTPVIYPPSMVPMNFRWALFLNPMAGVVEGFRFALLDKPLQGAHVLTSFAVAIAVFLCGLAYFQKTERIFSDIL